MSRRTQATVVIRRNEDDYLTVTVEADVNLEAREFWDCTPFVMEAA